MRMKQTNKDKYKKWGYTKKMKIKQKTADKANKCGFFILKTALLLLLGPAF